ncbi:MAG: hypothetical protein ABI171_23540 [Collimonas sp.]|uniref:hypothetical protein n=1 Tax=Collimonas sp. TaxID=1963772 RepID=UPI003262F2B4
MAQLPNAGEIYVTTKSQQEDSSINPKIGTRYLVEDVFAEQEDHNDDFFLITIVEENNSDDMSEMSIELDPDEWRNFISLYGAEKIAA